LARLACYWAKSFELKKHLSGRHGQEDTLLVEHLKMKRPIHFLKGTPQKSQSQAILLMEEINPAPFDRLSIPFGVFVCILRWCRISSIHFSGSC